MNFTTIVIRVLTSYQFIHQRPATSF